jgi:hypothetical protein
MAVPPKPGGGPLIKGVGGLETTTSDCVELTVTAGLPAVTISGLGSGAACALDAASGVDATSASLPLAMPLRVGILQKQQ